MITVLIAVLTATLLFLLLFQALGLPRHGSHTQDPMHSLHLAFSHIFLCPPPFSASSLWNSPLGLKQEGWAPSRCVHGLEQNTKEGPRSLDPVWNVGILWWVGSLIFSL